jgi:hypothetical protein
MKKRHQRPLKVAIPAPNGGSGHEGAKKTPKWEDRPAARGKVGGRVGVAAEGTGTGSVAVLKTTKAAWEEREPKSARRRPAMSALQGSASSLPRQPELG